MSALTYFNALATCLAQVQVTDGRGTVLELEAGMTQAMGLLRTVKATARKVMVVGNGGSAAIASHTQNDLCKSVGLRAQVFTEAPLLTAYANDLSYAAAFEQCVLAWGDPGDLLIAISSSGRSENILRAVKAASLRQCHTLTLSGFRPDNPLRTLGELNFFVAAVDYGPVELAHHCLLHYLTDSAAGLSGKTV